MSLLSESTQIIGCEELTELSPRNSVRAKKLTEFNVVGLSLTDSLWILDGAIENANRQSLVLNECGQLFRRPFRNSTGNEYYTNERQSRDSNRGTTNAESMRSNFCVFRGRYDCQRTLVLRIAVIALASNSAITIARFFASKLWIL